MVVGCSSSSTLQSSANPDVLRTLSATPSLGMSDGSHGEEMYFDVPGVHRRQARTPPKSQSSGHSKQTAEVGDTQGLGEIGRFICDRAL